MRRRLPGSVAQRAGVGVLSGARRSVPGAGFSRKVTRCWGVGERKPVRIADKQRNANATIRGAQP